MVISLKLDDYYQNNQDINKICSTIFIVTSVANSKAPQRSPLYICQVSFSGLVALFYATSMPTTTGLNEPVMGEPLETAEESGVWGW